MYRFIPMPPFKPPITLQLELGALLRKAKGSGRARLSFLKYNSHGSFSFADRVIAVKLYTRKEVKRSVLPLRELPPGAAWRADTGSAPTMGQADG